MSFLGIIMSSRAKRLAKGTRVRIRDNSGVSWMTLDHWCSAWEIQGFLPNQGQRAYQYKQWTLKHRRRGGGGKEFVYRPRSGSAGKSVLHRAMVGFPRGFKRADGLIVRKASREGLLLKSSAHQKQGRRRDRRPRRKRSQRRLPLEAKKAVRLLARGRY